MWRAFFLAVGFFAMIIGIECLGVERMVLRIHDDPPEANSFLDPKPTEGPAKQITPPPWAPWSMLSTGAVMCLYSFTIPRRVGGG